MSASSERTDGLPGAKLPLNDPGTGDSVGMSRDTRTRFLLGSKGVGGASPTRRHAKCAPVSRDPLGSLRRRTCGGHFIVHDSPQGYAQWLFIRRSGLSCAEGAHRRAPVQAIP